MSAIGKYHLRLVTQDCAGGCGAQVVRVVWPGIQPGAVFCEACREARHEQADRYSAAVRAREEATHGE